MIIELCCMSALVFSLSVSDLSQTAEFTAKGIHELNPIAAPFVEKRNSDGEIILGVASLTTNLLIEKYVDKQYAIPIQAVWALDHFLAVEHNIKSGYKKNINIVFPVITIRW